MATDAAAGVPVPEEADNVESLKNIIDSMMSRIDDLEKELHYNNNLQQDTEKLKPIDVKDIEKPDKYDNNITKFKIWYDKFRDLITNRHPNWYKLLKLVETKGKNTIRNQQEFFDDIDENDDKSYKYIKTQADMYAQQLKSYLRTYTEGELHARVIQTDPNGIMELMREIIYKGNNRNPNKLIDLKAKALSPQRANKVTDLANILTDWKHTRQLIMEEDSNYRMDEETMQTILLKIMPQDFVKDMREKLTEGKFQNDYYGFEQELFDEMATRKMDEDSKKPGGNLGAVNINQEETDEVEIWSDEWQCYICGIATKRGRHEEQEEDDEEPANKERRLNNDANKDKYMKGQGKRPVGPCWTCGGAHLQRDCPQANSGKSNFPTSTAWASWRPGTFPGPTPTQWNSWLPKPWKGKGKGIKGKGKGNKGKGKGKGQGTEGIHDMHWQQWGPPLGHMQGPQWDENEFMTNLLPICTVRHPEEPLNVNREIETSLPRKPSINIHNKYNALAKDYEQQYPEGDDQFPEASVTAATKDHKKMLKMPRGLSQKVKKQTKFQEKIMIAGVREAELDKEEFQMRAEYIRDECKKEREAASERQPLRHGNSLCTMQQTSTRPWSTWCPGWQYLSLTVDSGAAETVIPHMLVQDHPIMETQASKSGLNYTSATGDPIPNLGEQKLPLLTQEGSLRAMTFQAAPVERPLGSVKRMCNSGHRVVFDDEGSYVLNKTTGEINWLREDNGNYVMDLWVMPHKNPGFQRQR